MVSRLLVWVETRTGFFISLAVLSLGFALLRLIRITVPASRVFDEVYSPLFAWKYLQGESFFDVHPLLAEFQHVPGLLLFGDTPLGWRISAWFWGIVFVWGTAFAAYFLIGRRLAGVLAAFLVSIDTAFFIYGRTGLPDMFLLSQFSLALLCFFASMRMSDRRWALLAALGSGVFLGNVVATKWLGLAGVVSVWLWIAVQLTFQIIHRVKHCHVILSNSEGSRDRSEEQLAPMPQGPCPRAHLPNIPWWTYPVCFLLVPALTYGLWLLPFLGLPPAISSQAMEAGWYGYVGAAWARLKEWHWQVWNYHAHLTATHPYGSRWWEWPLLRHPVLFFYETVPGARPELVEGRRVINASGNIVLWWSGFAALVGGAGYALFPSLRATRSNPGGVSHQIASSAAASGLLAKTTILWMVLSALVFWLPWVFISRVSFNYHYFESFFFEVLLLTLLLVWLFDRPWYRVFAIAFLAAAVVGFVVLYPSATGLLIPSSISNIRWLFP